jgi:hypothetical protein
METQERLHGGTGLHSLHSVCCHWASSRCLSFQGGPSACFAYGMFVASHVIMHVLMLLLAHRWLACFSAAKLGTPATAWADICEPVRQLHVLCASLLLFSEHCQRDSSVPDRHVQRCWSSLSQSTGSAAVGLCSCCRWTWSRNNCLSCSKEALLGSVLLGAGE